jgi:hypothetical protein
MPSKLHQKKRARPASKRASPSRRPVAKKPAAPSSQKPSAPPPRPSSAKSSSRSGAPAAPPLEVPLPDGRRHVLSLSFVRDGDEFLARLETDSGHITELKNRSLDQLLTLVASELEDLLE